MVWFWVVVFSFFNSGNLVSMTDPQKCWELNWKAICLALLNQGAVWGELVASLPDLQMALTIKAAPHFT